MFRSIKVDEIDGSSLEGVCKSVEGLAGAAAAAAAAEEGEEAGTTTAAAAMAAVRTVESTLQLQAELDEAGRDVIVVVEFYAPWCPPCKVIWPDMAAFLQSHKDDVLLLRANVKKAPKLQRDYSIEGDSNKIVIFRNGRKVGSTCRSTPT